MLIYLLLAARLGSDPVAPLAPVREEIVVIAERGPEVRADVPAAVSVLSGEQIARLPAETLAELLRYLPGFQAYFPSLSAGTAPMVTARGFFGGGEAEYVQLRVDGAPVGDPESGLADWRRIRASDIERVEALRGPASSLYGDTALGGVIDVSTSAHGAPSPGGDLGGAASAGSFGGFSVEGWGQTGWSATAVSAGGSYSRSDGERAHAAGSLGGISAGAAGTAGGGNWSVDFSGASLRRDDPGPLEREAARADPRQSDPMFRFDREETRRGSLVAAWSRAAASWSVSGRFVGLLRRSDIVRTLPLVPGIGDTALRELETSGAGITLEGERAFRLLDRDARLRGGVETGRDALDGRYRSVDADGHAGPISAASSGHRIRTGVYLLQDWRAADRVRVTAGLRWDRIDDHFRGNTGGSATQSAWSPRIGVNWRLGASGATSVFAQYSQAFKAPTLDQLFDARPLPDFMGGAFTVSNPGLLPQRARTWEVGASGTAWERLGLEAVLYRIEVEDEIDFDPATFRFGNIGRSLHAGAETTARWLGAGPVQPFVVWAWSRVEPRDGENQGRQLKNVPEHLLRAGLAAELPAGFRGEAIASRMFGRFSDDANQVPLQDAWLLDLRLERAFGAFTAWLDVVNAGGGASDQIGFVLADFTGGAVAYVYPGPRRAIRGGVAYRH